MMIFVILIVFSGLVISQPIKKSTISLSVYPKEVDIYKGATLYSTVKIIPPKEKNCFHGFAVDGNK